MHLYLLFFILFISACSSKIPSPSICDESVHAKIEKNKAQADKAKQAYLQLQKHRENG